MLNSACFIGTLVYFLAKFHPFFIYLGVSLVFHRAADLYYDRVVLVVHHKVNHLSEGVKTLSAGDKYAISSYRFVWVIKKNSATETVSFDKMLKR